MKKWILRIVFSFLGLSTLFLMWVYAVTFHPDAVMPIAVQCSADAQDYQGQPLKIMTYNIQYLAGKGYVFYYDLPGNTGPDERPSPQSIQATLQGISTLIREQNPDVLLIQEFHDGAKATDYQNQLQLLQDALGDMAYACSAAAFYWKADFVPHPRIFGSVGMKLGTLSRYRLSSAARYQLPLIPADPITQAFNLKRAVLVTELAGTPAVSLLNTHLDAFAQGSDTMQRQVAQLMALLAQKDQQGHLWLLGGDFNLLAPSIYPNLPASQQYLYNPHTELSPLLEKYPSVPSQQDMAADPTAWFTHFPNDTDVSAPDRTIDYVFLSKQWQIKHAQVIRGSSLSLSDHLPLLLEVEPNTQIPATAQ